MPQLINQYLFTQKSILSMDLLHTKSIPTPYKDSGILGIPQNEKSPKTTCFKAFLAGSTRLELATSCVTGRRSNQLNYDPNIFMN